MRYPILLFHAVDTGQDGNGNPAADPTNPPLPADGEKKFTQAEFESKLDEKVKERELRLKRQMEAQQREAQQVMEAKQLEDQAEWQKLANKRADEIKELKPRAGLAEGYEKRVTQLMAEATKALPSNIQMILNKLSLPDQLDWLTENLDSVKAPPVTTGATDINAWSRTTGGAPALTDEEYLRRKRQESIYK